MLVLQSLRLMEVKHKILPEINLLLILMTIFQNLFQLILSMMTLFLIWFNGKDLAAAIREKHENFDF